MPPKVVAVGFGKLDAANVPLTPPAGTEVAAIVPLPIAAKLAPLPTIIAALVLVDPVNALKAVDEVDEAVMV
jgi:hypothetical protein